MDKLDINTKIINLDNIQLVSEEEITEGLNLLHSAGYMVGLSSGMELGIALALAAETPLDRQSIFAFMLHDEFSQYESGEAAK